MTTLVRFWANHHLLDIYQRPCWRVVSGRSKQYVDRITAQLPDVRTACPVSAARSLGPAGPVRLTFSRAASAEGGQEPGPEQEEEFDAVVLATHSDVSLKILGQQGPQVCRWPAAAEAAAEAVARPCVHAGRCCEHRQLRDGQNEVVRRCLCVNIFTAHQLFPYPEIELCWTAAPLPAPPLQSLLDVLAAIPYNDNDVWLHTDEALMPRNKKTWASWNFLGRSGEGGDR